MNMCTPNKNCTRYKIEVYDIYWCDKCYHTWIDGYASIFMKYYADKNKEMYDKVLDDFNECKI